MQHKIGWLFLKLTFWTKTSVEDSEITDKFFRIWCFGFNLKILDHQNKGHVLLLKFVVGRYKCKNIDTVWKKMTLILSLENDVHFPNSDLGNYSNVRCMGYIFFLDRLYPYGYSIQYQVSVNAWIAFQKLVPLSTSLYRSPKSWMWFVGLTSCPWDVSSSFKWMPALIGSSISVEGPLLF